MNEVDRMIKMKKDNYEKLKGRNLYIKNFDGSVTEDELKEIFSKFGKIESVKIMRDEDGYSKQFSLI